MWWAKIIAKIVLSRVPVTYDFWRRVGIFKHGSMEDAKYAWSVFDRHVTEAGLRGALHGKTIVELGPGDSIATALLARAHGATSVLVDTGRYARDDIAFYATLSDQLNEAGLPCPRLNGCRHLNDVLDACTARYLTRGLASLRELLADSADLIFSHAVLEHIRKDEFAGTLSECRRILKKGGFFSNQVDLQDHLGGALNNLRFGESFWESTLISRSGFYTNRIRYNRMLELFRSAGFTVEKTTPVSWASLPTPREKLAAQYQRLPDDDLRVYSFGVVLS